MTRDEMKEKLRLMIDHRRFVHTMGVESVAQEMAAIFKIDAKKASIAAILHDCAKSYKDDIAISLLKEAGKTVDEYMERESSLLHAPLGEVIAKEQFGITDEDILNAIRYHTTGRKGMSDLEKIIYIADLIEPSRELCGLDEIMEAAKEDLNKALRLSVASTIEYILQDGKILHPASVEAYNSCIFDNLE